MLPREPLGVHVPLSLIRDSMPLSRWTQSRIKRIFDVTIVFAMAPLVLPLLGTIAMAILAFCGWPILFRQARAGIHGSLFTMYKFRTMVHRPSAPRAAIAAHAANHVTPLGRILRRLKLDELPQVWNVLRGDMSLVGPRPKVPAQQSNPLECRPGLTGSATLAFACEEQLFAEIPHQHLDAFYREVVLPIKRRIDAHYMARATILSDLRILLLTAFARWHNAISIGEATSEHREGCSRLQPHLRIYIPSDGADVPNQSELSQLLYFIVSEGL